MSLARKWSSEYFKTALVNENSTATPQNREKHTLFYHKKTKKSHFWTYVGMYSQVPKLCGVHLRDRKGNPSLKQNTCPNVLSSN